MDIMATRTFAQRMEALANEKKAKIEYEKQQKKKHAIDVLQNNCALVANEIIKSIIKGLEDDAKDIENPIKVQWNYNDEQSRVMFSFSKCISKQLKDMLCNDLDINEICDYILFKCREIGHYDQQILLDKILHEQFETLGFRHRSIGTIKKIIEEPNFNLVVNVIHP